MLLPLFVTLLLLFLVITVPLPVAGVTTDRHCVLREPTNVICSLLCQKECIRLCSLLWLINHQFIGPV
jgi:hypothetical protein